MKPWQWVGLALGVFSLLRAVAKGEYLVAGVVLLIAVAITVVVVLVQEFMSAGRRADREDFSDAVIPQPYQPGEGRKRRIRLRRPETAEDRFRFAAEDLRQARIDDVRRSQRKRGRQKGGGSSWV
ncbi:MAG: hypothetical protein QOD39_153 [Mycobacterium sp.]|jgi:hypothetical protein|nr:hypothetical protein [Mycobacterium sp.]